MTEKCPECKSNKIVRDSETGEVICQKDSFVCAARASEGPAPLSPSCLPRVRELCLRCCADHLTGTLKAPSVIGAMMAQG